MSFGGIVLAEIRKTVTLPAAWAGGAVMVVLSGALTAYNASSVRHALAAGRPGDTAFGSAFETAFAAVPLGTAGAVVIGVIAIGSEYTANSTDAGGGRQVSATLAAVPQRIALLAAKAVTVMLVVAAAAAVTLLATVSTASVLVGPHATSSVTGELVLTRSLGAALYWVLTALIGFALTVLTRSGVVPLTVLIVNSSLVPFSLLLTYLTPLAHWLPDMAGRRLLGTDTIAGGLGAVPGAFVMAGWTLLLLVVAAVAFQRRDA